MRNNNKGISQTFFNAYPPSPPPVIACSSSTTVCLDATVDVTAAGADAPIRHLFILFLCSRQKALLCSSLAMTSSSSRLSLPTFDNTKTASEKTGWRSPVVVVVGVGGRENPRGKQEDHPSTMDRSCLQTKCC